LTIFNLTARVIFPAAYEYFPGNTIFNVIIPAYPLKTTGADYLGNGGLLPVFRVTAGLVLEKLSPVYSTGG